MNQHVSCFSDFHTGRFLRELMEEEGHDTLWLSGQTGIGMDVIEGLFGQMNMDAELFVRLGQPLNPLFLQRVDEMIFGSKVTA